MHRFILEPYRSHHNRYQCPECRARSKTFSRYIDAETGNHLADHVGRCSRDNNCGYHCTPKQYFKETDYKYLSENTTVQRPLIIDNKTPVQHQPPSFIQPQLITRSLAGYSRNNLVKYLCHQFGDEAAMLLVKKYHVGTSRHWPGASIFWQADVQGNYRTGKIMLYNAETGRRVKQPYNHIAWVHGLMRNAEDGMRNEKTFAINNPHSHFNLKQCLFGEHLLCTEPDKPVALVESEKTAIIASYHLPEYIWLATGGMHSLNASTCKVLKGRMVQLFPDVNVLDAWKQKVTAIEPLLPNTIFRVSALLERLSTQRERLESWDVGDYLVR